MARIRQSRPDSGLGFQVKVVQNILVLPASPESPRFPRKWEDERSGRSESDLDCSAHGPQQHNLVPREAQVEYAHRVDPASAHLKERESLLNL
jgi:hypothetical protein